MKSPFWSYAAPLFFPLPLFLLFFSDIVLQLATQSIDMRGVDWLWYIRSISEWCQIRNISCGYNAYCNLRWKTNEFQNVWQKRRESMETVLTVRADSTQRGIPQQTLILDLLPMIILIVQPPLKPVFSSFMNSLLFFFLCYIGHYIALSSVISLIMLLCFIEMQWIIIISSFVSALTRRLTSSYLLVEENNFTGGQLFYIRLHPYYAIAFVSGKGRIRIISHL